MYFAQTQRYLEKIMLEISGICLCLFFRDGSVLNKIAILGQPPRCFLIFSLLGIYSSTPSILS